MNAEGNNYTRNAKNKIELDAKSMKALSQMTNNDSLLLYIFCVSSLTIGLTRINPELGSKVGIPSIDGNKISPLLNTSMPKTFKDYLLAIKDNIANLMQADSDSDCEGITTVISFEGINNNFTKNFDLWFDISYLTELYVDVAYNNIRFDISYIKMLVKSIQYVIKKCLADTAASIDELLTANAEEQQLVSNYNNKAEIVEYGKLRSIPTGFNDSVKKYNNNIALVENDRIITYGELDRESDMLANFLLEKGIEKNNIVAIVNGRTVETIVSMLAILKTGAAYAPIDANYPIEKISNFLDNTDFKLILTMNSFLHLISNEHLHKTLCLDAEKEHIQDYSNFEYKEDMESLCYVIFTSGSTGIPKVAAVKHIGWSNLLQWFSDRYKIYNEDRVYLISSISFDISQRSIFMALINGAALHLNPDIVYDPLKIRKYIHTHDVTLLNCAPSTFYPLVEDCDNFQELASLRCLFLGGEAISANRLIKWYNSEHNHAIISNVYGVAECSDVSSFYELNDLEVYMSRSVPIGYPIYNNQLYIVNEKRQYMPPGSIGEICIAGMGIGAGYINDKVLSNSKFVKLQDGKSVYLTGDLGCFNEEFIEYVGRKDYQVKIRGNRVELGDIENAIRKINCIQEAVVVINKYEQVISYVIKNDSSSDFINNEQILMYLYKELNKKLPTYMIPDKIQLIDDLPVNENGKIDRLKLANMDVFLEKEEIKADVNESEKKVLDIITNLSNRTSINIEENFFNQGIHSIIVVKLVTIINERFKVSLAPIDIYLNSNVRSLTERIFNGKSI